MQSSSWARAWRLKNRRDAFNSPTRVIDAESVNLQAVARSAIPHAKAHGKEAGQAGTAMIRSSAAILSRPRRPSGVGRAVCVDQSRLFESIRASKCVASMRHRPIIRIVVRVIVLIDRAVDPGWRDVIGVTGGNWCHASLRRMPRYRSRSTFEQQLAYPSSRPD